MNKGSIYAVFAYLLWGFLPVFWKLLRSVPANEILCHRIVWTLFFVFLLLLIKKRWEWLKLIRSKPRILLTYFITAGTATSRRLKGRYHPSLYILEIEDDTVLLKEANDAVDVIKKGVGKAAEVIFGVTLNSKLNDEVKVILFAVGNGSGSLGGEQNES